MLKGKAVVMLAYAIAAAAIAAMVVVSVAWGVQASVPYYVPAALIALSAGAIHYNTRKRDR
ncbi:hypothetical protein AMK21_18635 [Streptomyces sp. CB00316]|uniref:hypothetical protein n=1 Tax=unclassified Streptomyces TaxID=2593676 RepID=UPI00093C7297|nr:MULTISPECIES: hypothetical protein [unclassified Streptomyces]MBT2379607.1 hypothetical protein [Streptomyces sp. ISL-111]MBT2430451.1 hypothetical protein [Streptomyces sp. ISL-112]MBT2462279.1 hypothetical protein [Streptomyces sp. ISL-63]OKJ19134.1 hypothetical protein AMK21_18635 [Streptomyces sp. CB00316]